MPLVSARHIAKHAQQECYAVPLFDFFELTGLEDYFAALEDRQAPAITGMYSAWFEKPVAPAFIAAVRALAEQTTVPVALMLDHGSSPEQCLRAVEAGFTDVMYDGSKLPMEENIANTQAVVEKAHAAGVAVEAELGHVGSGKEYQDYGARRKGFTDPESVARFVSETSVDMLAVAIGTAHGVYDGDPTVDMELLESIRKVVDIPLVLHGGSGLSDEQFRGAITRGISKINVATDLVRSAADALREAARVDDAPFFAMTKAIHETMRERCSHYLDLFGASGHANEFVEVVAEAME